MIYGILMIMIGNKLQSRKVRKKKRIQIKNKLIITLKKIKKINRMIINK